MSGMHLDFVFTEPDMKLAFDEAVRMMARKDGHRVMPGESVAIRMDARALVVDGQVQFTIAPGLQVGSAYRGGWAKSFADLSEIGAAVSPLMTEILRPTA